MNSQSHVQTEMSSNDIFNEFSPPPEIIEGRELNETKLFELSMLYLICFLIQFFKTTAYLKHYFRKNFLALT